MKKHNSLLTGIGIWASGMLVGASAVDLLSLDSPAWHPALRLGVGLLIGLVSLAGFRRADHSTTAQ